LCRKGEKETFELLKIKGVAAIASLVIVMIGASVYTVHKTALAEHEIELEEPQCTVLLYPDIVNVTIGETFNVRVFVDDVKNLYGFEVGLVFNRSVIEYVGAKEPNWRIIGGQLEWIFWAAGIAPQNGEVDLIEFTFKGIAKGNSPISFSLHTLATSKYWEIPHDYVGWPIPHIVSEGIVNVS